MKPTVDNLLHPHTFEVPPTGAERTMIAVSLITGLMMVAEIISGLLFDSMALLADGWHMATHVLAFAVSAFAYRFTRTQANNRNYSFGTGKVNVLGAFANAIALAVIALFIVAESIMRFFATPSIKFNEAITVAVIGLAVNLICAFIMQSRAKPAHHDHGHDLNHESALAHVFTDALTSVLAIIALIGAKWMGWLWLDPAMGLVGAALIGAWSWSLIQSSGQILIDGNTNTQLSEDIKSLIEKDDDSQITDLHVWRITPNHFSAVIAIATHKPQAPNFYKQLIQHLPGLSHVLIEVNVAQASPD